MKSYSLIFLVFILGILGKNRLIYISAGVLMVFSFLNLLPNSPSSQKVLLDVGVMLLVMGVLMPLSQGNFLPWELYRSLLSRTGIVAFLVGIASSVMAREGVYLMKEHPEVTLGLLFGTIIGATFLGGIPVGPLVAAGLAAYILIIIKKI